MKTGLGANGQAIMFYRRRKRQSSSCGRRPVDAYLSRLIASPGELGIERISLAPGSLQATLTALFGSERPALEVAVPEVAKD